MTTPLPTRPGGIAPAGLPGYIAGLPFLGRLTSAHHGRRVEAGSVVELVFDYEVGAAALADGGWLKIAFRFYSDWSLFQTADPAAADYLSAELLSRPPFPGESPATVRELKVRFDQKGHERPYQKAILVDVVDGYLKPGDVIRIRAGDRRFGGPGTRIQTFVEEAFRFRAYVDTAGTSRFAAVPGDVVLDIASGPATRLEVTTPRLVRAGEPVPLHVRAEDRWGNLATVDSLELHLDGGTWGETAPAPSLPGSALRRIALFPDAGTFSLRATAPKEGLASTAPVTVEAGLAVPRAWFADLHVHSHDTVGTNSTERNFAYARDAAALDVLGYTVNDFQIREDRWNEAVALARTFHQEGKFVVFPGTEWCGSSAAGGDHNVVFLGDEIRFPRDAAGRSLRSFEWNEDTTAREQIPGRWPLSELYAAYADQPEDFLFIPHVGGRRAILDWHHPGLDRLIEIASSWGHFDWFYRDALSRGWQLGASAAGDEHRGRPGGGAPGVSVFGARGGLTGILSEKLERADIAAALRARHTWATTGERNVALLRSGPHRQGDAFAHAGSEPLEVAYRLLGRTGWERLELRDHAGSPLIRNLHAELGYSPRRLRVTWGGARIKDRYRWAVWRGKITVEGATLRQVRAFGLEHPEEQAAQTGEREITFASETYGDADGVEFDLSDLAAATIRVEVEIDGFNKTGSPLDRNPWKECPRAEIAISGREWAEGKASSLRRDLPGAELFLEIERITEAPLPIDIAGTFTVAPGNASFGFLPLHLFGRERDDAKAWTSPLFITFT
ncbi:hypothetical protein SAMN05444156_2095 [Verrucomicrobium sp. GAS474]|uniref:hypothetical protein n=1 Tax=Verrucomicrobium sp. GAS474 TaxID=1882831 RepID=UPI00087A3DCA|nr:hypothetical protein [Verrucomicrobium sp. GAS474]SDU12360.1 hypothetical protein SAMN05444156_2095 [Verrucomicrobium sp. GAS474]